MFSCILFPCLAITFVQTSSLEVCVCVCVRVCVCVCVCDGRHGERAIGDIQSFLIARVKEAGFHGTPSRTIFCKMEFRYFSSILPVQT